MNHQEEIHLSDDLHQIVAGHPPFVPDVEAIERRGHQLRRRSTAIRGAAGLGAAGLAAALVGVLVIPEHSSTRAHSGALAPSSAPARKSTGGPAASKPPVETVAYVTKQLAVAESDADHYIIETTNRSQGDTSTDWTDPSTDSGYGVNSGTPKSVSWVQESVVSNIMHWRTTQVDYANHTWWTADQSAGAPLRDAPPGPAVFGGSPAEIAKDLVNGRLRIVGHAMVRQHDTIEVQTTVKSLLSYNIFIDSKTYRPIRVIKFIGRVPATYNEYWIPKTPANVKLTNHPRIPAGFTRVPAPQ